MIPTESNGSKDELQQLIDEQNKDELLSDEQDLVSQMDIDDFEQRLNTSQSFVREKPQKQNSRTQSGMSSSSKQPQSLKDLNEKMQQNIMKKQQTQQAKTQMQRKQPLSQTQQVPKPPEKRKSVEPKGMNARSLLESAQRDNQELLQKMVMMKKQLQSLEAENQELKQEIQKRGNSSGFLPRIESAANSELKQLRQENEELKKMLQKQYGNDAGKMLQMYGLQVVKLKCKIEELTSEKQ